VGDIPVHAFIPAFERLGTSVNQSINLLKAKIPNGHLHRSKIHGMQ